LIREHCGLHDMNTIGVQHPWFQAAHPPGPLVRQYEKLILHDRVEAGMSLKDALKIYNYFHQLRRAPLWGDICVSCTCRVCFANCVCKD
jgi:hypothetical protein